MRNTVAEKIANNIKIIRKEKGMTQSDLARKLGGHGKEIVERVESGNANIAIAYYYRIAKALGVPISRITVSSNPIQSKKLKIKTISALDDSRYLFDEAVNEFIANCQKLASIQYQYTSNADGQIFKSVMITYY